MHRIYYFQDPGVHSLTCPDDVELAQLMPVCCDHASLLEVGFLQDPMLEVLDPSGSTFL
jgi:hypothetical protein